MGTKTVSECNRDPWHRIPFLLRIRRPINIPPSWTLVWNLRDLNMGGKGTPITVYRHDYFFRFKPLSLWKWAALNFLFLLHWFCWKWIPQTFRQCGNYFGFRDKNLGRRSVLNYSWNHIHTRAYIHTHMHLHPRISCMRELEENQGHRVFLLILASRQHFHSDRYVARERERRRKM